MNETTQKTAGYAWYALGLLTLVYVMNFLDRQIIYILFPSLKTEFVFSDLQLALLGSTSFAIFYTALGIPFGRIADRGSRKYLIAAGLAVWSLFSGLTGFAEGFWSLFACRVMVGVGEATLGPAAISLLSDYFPPAKRATVTSIYSMGIAIGAGMAAILGGYLVGFGWRTAFYIVGFPGLVLAVMVFFLIEPKRSELTVAGNTSADQPETASAKVVGLWSAPFILLCLGYAFLGLATNNLSLWGATYVNRVFKLPIPTIGYWLGIMTLAAGVPATLFGGTIADWFRRRARGGRMLYGSILSFVSLILWLILLSTDNFAIMVPTTLILFAALAWLGAAAADATEISGVNLRGVAIAIYFFSVNIFAYIIGSNLIGFLSDRFGATENPSMMRYALFVCPISCLLSTICLFIGSRILNRADANFGA